MSRPLTFDPMASVRNYHLRRLEAAAARQVGVAPLITAPPPESGTIPTRTFLPATPAAEDVGELIRVQTANSNESDRIVTAVPQGDGSLAWQDVNQGAGAWPAPYSSQWGSAGSGNGQFGEMRGVSPDLETGDLYVASDDRIQRFASNGTYVSTIATLGSAIGQVNSPGQLSYLRTTSNRFLWVADTGNSRISYYIINTAAWGSSPGPFGTLGAGTSNFDRPQGVQTRMPVNVPSPIPAFIADTNNHRVSRWKEGNPWTYEYHWGSQGSAPGQFLSPTHLALDRLFRVWVVDQGNHRVQVFNEAGGLLFVIGALGGGRSQFKSPTSIAIDVQGNAHVTDTGNNRVQVFDQNGIFQGSYGQLGSGDDDFNAPTAIAITDDYIYVADNGNKRVVIRANPAARPRNDGFQIPFIIYDGGTATQWTNQPAAATEFFGNVYFRKPADLTGMVEFRITAEIFTAGAAGAKWHAEYSTDGGTVWTDCGVQATQEIAIGTTGQKKGAWTSLEAAARTDVLLRLVGTGGDGVADPFPTNVAIQVR